MITNWIIMMATCMMGLSGGENPQTNPKDKQQEKEIYLAGGCFWGTEHFLKQIEGIKTSLYCKGEAGFFV